MELIHSKEVVMDTTSSCDWWIMACGWVSGYKTHSATLLFPGLCPSWCVQSFHWQKFMLPSTPLVHRPMCLSVTLEECIFWVRQNFGPLLTLCDTVGHSSYLIFSSLKKVCELNHIISFLVPNDSSQPCFPTKMCGPLSAQQTLVRLNTERAWISRWASDQASRG